MSRTWLHMCVVIITFIASNRAMKYIHNYTYLYIDSERFNWHTIVTHALACTNVRMCIYKCVYVYVCM